MTSEDLLVAKLRKWSYDEVFDAVIQHSDFFDLVEFFLYKGWTQEEYKEEWERRWYALDDGLT